MQRKGPHVASLDEVTITRNGDAGVIEYADPSVWTAHFRLGPEVQHMIVFVPDDELHEVPRIEVREPEEKRGR